MSTPSLNSRNLAVAPWLVGSTLVEEHIKDETLIIVFKRWEAEYWVYGILRCWMSGYKVQVSKDHEDLCADEVISILLTEYR